MDSQSQEKTNILSLQIPNEETKEECMEDCECIQGCCMNGNGEEETLSPNDSQSHEETKEDPGLVEIKIDENRKESNVKKDSPLAKSMLREFLTNNLMFLYKGFLYYTSCSVKKTPTTSNEPM